MNDEDEPLLERRISVIEPDCIDEASAITHRSHGVFSAWRRAKRLDSFIIRQLLYPFFWIIARTSLTIQNYQVIYQRSPCMLCRKRAGTLDQLSNSSSQGCPDCALFAEALATMAPQIEPELGMFSITPETMFRRFPLELSVWNVGGFERASFKFLAPQVSKKDAPVYRGTFLVPQDSTSDESMAFAEKTIAECMKNHKGCRRSRLLPLPRRVLDLRSFNPALDVRLYEPRGKCAKYIALSHTWGHKHTFMTNTSNLEQRLRLITLESLPKTFQDAIFIARKLRIQYLWIDSLCIVQDDIADWERESPKMGTIYGNAFLTIAAGSALNDQSGFLGIRSDFMYRDFLMKKKLGPCVFVSRVQDMTAPTRRDPLSFRAWALQERLLSRRTLYYHQQELVFECNQGLVCECMSCSRVIEKYRKNDSEYWARLGLKFDKSGFPRIQIPKSAAAEDLQHFWRKFITAEYSARSISRDSDRLPALSSVASAVQVLSGNDYLAGMWHQWLPSELAWTSIHNLRTRNGQRVLGTIPSTYVAPSWCWASISGPIEYKSIEASETLVYQVSVLYAGCAVVGLNPFGNVENGSITLLGKAICGTCELQTQPDKLWPYRIKLFLPTQRQMTLGFEPDVAFLADCEIPHPETKRRETEAASWLSIGRTLKRASVPELTDEYSMIQGRLSFGRVKCLLLYTDLKQARCEWVFLVLGHSAQAPGLYARLGLLTCWVNGCAAWTELDGVIPEGITIV